MAAGDDYWNQFIATVAFMEPTEIEGVIEWLDTTKVTGGTAPMFLVRLDSGQGFRVVATQARLLEELTRKRPRAGDTIKITYHGEAAKAAPGMSPTKEFSVEVTRNVSPPSGRPAEKTATTPARSAENAPGAGK